MKESGKKQSQPCQGDLLTGMVLGSRTCWRPIARIRWRRGCRGCRIFTKN